MKTLSIISIFLLLTLFPPLNSLAETEDKTNNELKTKILELETKMFEMQKKHLAEMQALTEQVKALKSIVNTSSQVVQVQTAPKPTGSIKSENIFNPKISVISDMVGVYGKQGDASYDNMLVREVEIGFSEHVDTWGRYDVTTTIHNDVEFDFGLDEEHDYEHEAHSDGLTIEEAYFTFLTLPSDLQARVGKFRAAVGKTNELHPHSLPWTEYPLAIRNYLGTEGLIGTGVSLSWLAPIDNYTELTYQFYKANPIHTAAVAPEEVEDYSHLFKLKTFFEISDNASLEIGATSLLAAEEPGFEGDETWLNALDLTVKWQPFGDGSYRQLEWRNEFFGLRKSLGLDNDHDHETEDEDHEEVHEGEMSRESMFGYYSSLGYRFNRWFEAGVRFDYAEGPFDLHMEEKEYGAFLTWWQSEYAFWRLNVIRNELLLDDMEMDPMTKVYLQFNLSLGPHPAHKY